MEGRARTAAFWIFTLPVAFENAASAMWVFLPLIPGVNHSHQSLVLADYIRRCSSTSATRSTSGFILGPCNWPPPLPSVRRA